MKIADVKTTRLVVPLEPPLADSTHVLEKVDWILVDVITDEGITGHSFMLSFDYGPTLLQGIIDAELKKLIVGKDPSFIKRIWESGWSQTEYIGNEGVSAWGLAAIDIALWDVLGKRLGCPVHQLLGTFRDQVPVYGSGGWLSYSLDQLLEEVSGYVARGFRAVKIKVGGPDLKRDVERVTAVRKAIGNDVALMLDANQAWTLHQAIAFAKKVQHLDITWLEEPVSKDDLQGYARVSSVSGIPIATGEREYSLKAFKDIMQANAAAVIQPDVLRIGGITQCLKVANMAEAFGLRVANHFYKEIDIHILASIRNGFYLEYFPWLDPLLMRPLDFRGGMASVPQGPGLGIELKPEAIEEYRFA